MAAIHDVRLAVGPVDGHPASRRLRVEYELELEPDHPAVGRPVEERTRVRAVDEHDAAVRPATEPAVQTLASFVARAGRTRHAVEATVHRLALDVEADWWAADLGGEALPIAEWLDHLVAEVAVALDGVEVAAATSAVVTGSWGVLGRD